MSNGVRDGGVGVARRLAVLAVVVLVVAASVAVAQPQPEWAPEVLSELQRFAASHPGAPPALGPLTAPLANERVTLVVTAADGSRATYAFETDGAIRVTGLRMGAHPDPTLRMTTTRAAVDTLAASPDPEAAFVAAVRGDEVRIEGIGFVRAAMWRVINLALVAVVDGGAGALYAAG